MVYSYYGHNDYRDYYLAHHGIVGMHWGIRRFQPYGQGGYLPDHKGKFQRLENRKARLEGKLSKTNAKINDSNEKIRTIEENAKRNYKKSNLSAKINKIGRQIDRNKRKNNSVIRRLIEPSFITNRRIIKTEKLSRKLEKLQAKERGIDAKYLRLVAKRDKAVYKADRLTKKIKRVNNKIGKLKAREISQDAISDGKKQVEDVLMKQMNNERDSE